MELVALTTPRTNRFIPGDPTEKQAAFLLLDDEEALYGGAAGGGKSDALLRASLQYADVPGYAALLLRRSFPALKQPGALIPRSHEWLAGSEASWNAQDKRWSFPGGATLTFGYLLHESDVYQYQGSEFDFIGFDETTQFTEFQYTYLFSRLRRRVRSPIPSRLRSATNPGGIGHDWVKRRFIPFTDPVTGAVTHPLGPGGARRPFVRALIEDNPHLDRREYERRLMHLDPITRARLLAGDWDVIEGGSMFQRWWFPILEARPRFSRAVRFWDLAATEEPTFAQEGSDPDYTAGALMGISETDRRFVLADLRRGRWSPQQTERIVLQTSQLDGPEVAVYIEQEPGSAGKALVSYYQRLLAGRIVHGVPSMKDKETRAAPVASQAEAGNIALVNGAWVEAFLSEVEGFPMRGHDDQVDALSGAFHRLLKAPEAHSTSSIPDQHPDIVKRGDLTLKGRRYVDRT